MGAECVPEDNIDFNVTFSANLTSWETHPEYLSISPDQAGVPSGFKRMRITYPASQTRLFLRLQAR